MDEMMRAEVDRDACKGHGRCYMTAPELFDADDDGFPIIIADAAGPQAVANLDRAVNNCPELAIKAEPVEALRKEPLS